MSIRKITIPLALAAPALAIGLSLSPLSAQTDEGAAPSQAVLNTRATVDQAIAGGVMWRCEGTRCIAPQSRKRPLRVCRELQQEVGTIAHFEMNGRIFGADNLARCNR